jgi:hypothetical protein
MPDPIEEILGPDGHTWIEIDGVRYRTDHLTYCRVWATAEILHINDDRARPTVPVGDPHDH